MLLFTALLYHWPYDLAPVPSLEHSDWVAPLVSCVCAR